MKYLKDTTLMIVEDNAEAQKQLEQLLQDHVKEIYHAYNGTEALETYQTRKPDIILSDIRMPSLNGLNMARQIKEKDPLQPIMFLSARPEPEILMEAINMSIDGFLTKPIVDIEHLLRGLERLAHKAHAHRELVRKGAEDAAKEYQTQMKILRQRSFYDHLTRMPNRLFFTTHLKESIEGARQSHTQLALLYIDLDNLKQINDQHGHQVGDHAIKRVVSNIQDVINPKDFFARIGGDEFALIIETVESKTDLIAPIEKILAAASLPMYSSQIEISISCSIGISFYPQDAPDMLELIHRADQAMYRSKRAGKNGYTFWEASET